MPVLFQSFSTFPMEASEASETDAGAGALVALAMEAPEKRQSTISAAMIAKGLMEIFFVNLRVRVMVLSL